MSTLRQILPSLRRAPGSWHARLVLVLCVALLGGVVTSPGAHADAPATPGGLSPNSADGTPSSQRAFSDVRLTWAPVAGATGYEIAISESSSFNPVLTSTSSTNSWALPSTVPAGDYVWHVRAVTSDAVGAWSGIASFTHSWESAPSNVQLVTTAGVPAVTWDGLPGASFYEVEFSLKPYSASEPQAMQASTEEDRFTCFTQHTYLAPYGTATGGENLPGDEKNCAFGAATQDPRVTAIETAFVQCEKPGFTADVDGCERTAIKAQLKVNPLSFKAFFPAKKLVYDESLSLAQQMPSSYPSIPWYVRVRGRNGSTDATVSPFGAPSIACTGVWHSAEGTQDPETGNVTVPIPSTVPKYIAVPECSSWTPPTSFFLTASGWDQDLSGVTVGGAAAGPVTGAALRVTPVFTWTPVPHAAKYRVYVSRTRDLRSADHVWETKVEGSLSPYGTLPDAQRLYWGVQACGWETCGPIGAVQTFTKVATSPVAALASATTPLDASFSWRPQTDAARVGALVPATDSEARNYQLQVAVAGTGFATPVVDVLVDASRLPSDGLDISRATVSLVGLPEGIYSWRVRAIDESGFAYPYADGSDFTRILTVPAPPSTGGAGPAAGQEPIPGTDPTGSTPDPTPVKDVVLDWAPIPGAAKYQLQVGTTEDWSDDPVLDVTTVSSQYIPSITLPDATYVWRVRALTATTQADWSANSTFTKGWTASPAPLQPVGTFPAGDGGRFAWAAVPEASFYEIQVSSSADFADASGVPTDTCFTPHTSVTPYSGLAVKASLGDCVLPDYDLSASKPLFWRVRAHDGTADTKNDWVTGAVARSGLSVAPLKATPGAPAATPGASQPSAWSAATAFTSSSGGTPSPLGVFPAAPRPRPLAGAACTGGTCTDTPTLRWNPVVGATGYRVSVYLDSAVNGSPTNVQRVWETRFTSLTASEVLRDNTVGKGYRVAVQACSVTRCSPNVTPFSFKKLSRQVAQTAPKDGASLNMRVTDTVFSWSDYLASSGGSDSLEAQSYHLQIAPAADSTFIKPAVDVQVDATQWAPADTVLPDGGYVWRVQAVDATGRGARWSVARDFVRDTVAPKVALSLKDGFSQASALGLAFSEPVRGVDAGSVTARLSGRLVSSRVSGSAAAWSLTPAQPWTTGGTYTFSVADDIHDIAGNALVPITAALRASLVADTSGVAVTRQAKVWSAMTASDAKGKAYVFAAGKATLSTVVVGNSLQVYACRSPKSGLASVVVDGRAVAKIDLYRAWSGCGRVWSQKVPQAKHAVSVVALSTKNRKSKGTRVGVDAITTS